MTNSTETQILDPVSRAILSEIEAADPIVAD